MPQVCHAWKSRAWAVSLSEIRIRPVLDADRRAVLLVAGDKVGNGQGWYKSNTPLTELRAYRLREVREESGVDPGWAHGPVACHATVGLRA